MNTLLQAKSAYHILVVEPDNYLRDALIQAIEYEGYGTTSLTTAKDCIQHCLRDLPNLVILASKLPDQEALKVVEQLQSRLSQDCPPVLMLASQYDLSFMEKAFALGVRDYLLRPIHWSVFRQRVQQLIEMQICLHQLDEKLWQEKALMGQLTKTKLRIEGLSQLDEVTQLKNRKSFEEELLKTWRVQVRERQPVSLILLELSYLQSAWDEVTNSINFEYLKVTSHAITSILKRPNDIAARYQEKQFIILLPNTPLDGAIHLAKTLQQAIQLEIQTTVVLEKSMLDPVFNIGIASQLAAPQQEIQGLMETLRRSLSQSKDKGINSIAYLDASPSIS